MVNHLSNRGFIPAFNYNVLTPFYDALVSALGYGEAVIRRIVTLLDIKPQERILDVGCGTGSLLIALKQQFPNNLVTGSDIDEQVLSIAKAKAKRRNVTIDFVQASADKLPFDDASFDVVVSSLAFHHLPTGTKQGAANEIYRVLKPQGRFLLADFGKKQGFASHALDLLTKVVRAAESKTIQDNFQGKMPDILHQADLIFRQVAPRYRGIEFLLARKTSNSA